MPCRPSHTRTSQGKQLVAHQPLDLPPPLEAMLRQVSVCLACQTPSPPEARDCPRCGAILPAPVAPFPGGMVELGWGRVVLGAKLGDGGMGTVYRGWLSYNPAGPFAGSPRHEVAVKVLHPMLSSREHVRRLFQGEAEAMASLSHPNVVRFFGMSEASGQLAIVLELVEGDSLDRVIERSSRRAVPGGLPAMPFMRAWYYFQQLLGALAATHALGIVHRDVKPANLLLRHDGLAKLTDFGIARLPADVARTTGGMQPGTGAYMSPEQVNGQQLDGRSDLYSAAIVLYEMLTGRTPFDAPGRSELVIRAAQLDEVAPPLCQFIPRALIDHPGAPHASAVLDQLMARALAKYPAHRFSSAIELGNAFRTALQLPDTSGWQAQQNFAHKAKSLADPPRGKGGTQKIPEVEANRLRADLASAYQYDPGTAAR